MLQLLWNTLAYMGAAQISDLSRQKHIVLVNGMALLVSLFCLANLPILFFFESGQGWILYFCLGLSLLLPPGVLILNGRGHYQAARYYFALLCLVFVTGVSLAYGNKVDFHMYLMVELALILFMFPHHRRYSKISLSLITLGVFIWLDFILPGLESQVRFIPGMAAPLKIWTHTGVALLLLAFVCYLNHTINIFERYLQVEQEKSQRLLHNILPASVARKILASGEPDAERFEHCTVLFSDIVGFSKLAREMSATEVVDLLNQIFSEFDDLADKHGLEKIKTIGDAYMAAGGLPDPDEAHAEKMARFALEMLQIVKWYGERTKLPLQLRIGINSGDAVAGIIGKRKFIYDLWGDNVNTAARMESHGLPGEIQVTESTYQLLKDKFEFESRGQIPVKGMGKIKSYFLRGELPAA